MRSYSASELNTIRARPQGAKWYLAVHRPFPVAYYQIHGDVSYPASNLPVSFLSGLSGSIRENQTVYVGTGSGLYNLGMTRITIPPSTSTILNVAESGSGLINWEKSGDVYLTVMNEMRPWAFHPRYDISASQWRMDGYIAFSTAKQFAPYPNIDHSTVAVLNGASSWTASYIGTSSLFWDNSYLLNSWYFPSGSTDTGKLGTQADPVTAVYTTASPGGSYVRLELIDSVGGSNIGHRLTFLFNDYSQIPRVSFAEITGGVEDGGYNTRFNVFNLNDADIPPGTEILIFEEPDYAGSQISLGTNGVYNKNIVFRGWTTAELSNVNPLTSSATIEATTIHGIMDQMASYDIFTALSSTGASHWIEVPNLSLDRVAYQALKWRSNISQIANFTPASGLAISGNIQFQSLEKGSLYSQLRSNYYDKGYLGYFASDTQSNLFAFEDAQITGASVNVPKLMHINYADRINTVQINRDYRELNSQVQLYAVASVTPLGAESPGGVMGYFGTTQEISQGLFVDNQDTLVTWSGNLRAKQNAEFKNVVIPLAGNYKIDAVPQTRISTTLSSIDNARGLSWNNKNFWVNNVRTTYNANARYVQQEITTSEIVDGIGGSSITFPTVDDIVPAPVQLPSAQVTTPDVSVPGFGTGLKTVYAMCETGLGRTRDFSATSPTWNSITGVATGTLREFILDPWTPAMVGYLVTDNGVWRSSDLNNDSPVWTNTLPSSTIVSNISGATTLRMFGHIEASINQEGYIAYFCQVTNLQHLYCIYTGDRGDTWNYSLISNDVNSSDGWMGAAGLVQHVVNGGLRLFCAFRIASFPGSQGIAIYRSDDGGATWNLVSNNTGINNINNATLHIPYNDNDNGNIWYLAPPANAVTTNGGSTFSSLGSSISTTPAAHRWGIESYTSDRNFMYRPDITNCKIFVSDDGFATKSEAAMNGATGTILSTGGFPTNGDQFYLMTASGIYVSLDRGENWFSKTSDYPFALSSFSIRRGVIVPLWTE